ncbi:MAG: alkaline phosphatase, partial [Coraliomargaritaceae bacterium]
GKGTAKNCIFLVVDGMGRGTLSIANEYSKKHFGRELNWIQLLKNKQVVTALQNTISANSLVTDSAAAGSAWASGQRIPNGRINVTAEGRHLNPVFSQAKRQGKAIGLVTTTRITHATPASFVCSVEDRDDEASIARQYLEQDIDVLIGGGARYFNDDNDALLKAYSKAGYIYADTLDKLFKDEHASKLLGLFSDSHIPYAIDRKYSKRYEKVPDLEAMFRVALSNLSQRQSGFCLQVEAGRVDHAGHAQDMAALIQEQLEFDRLIPIALEFVEQQPDTLLIITTDHGTGGCQLNGYGEGYAGSNKTMDLVATIKASYEFIAEELNHPKNLNKQFFKSLLNIDLSDKDLSVIQAMLDKQYRIFPFGYRDSGSEYFQGFKRDYLAANLGSYFESYFAETMGLAWTSDAHTSELVDLMALGSGADIIPQYIENFELNRYLREALNI